MPVASASVPMVRPSSPALLTILSASSRIAARVRSPLVLVRAWAFIAASNSKIVRIGQAAVVVPVALGVLQDGFLPGVARQPRELDRLLVGPCGGRQQQQQKDERQAQNGEGGEG